MPSARVVAYLVVYGYWYSVTEVQWAALVAAGVARREWNLYRMARPLRGRPGSVRVWYDRGGDRPHYYGPVPVIRPLDFDPGDWRDADREVRASMRTARGSRRG